MLPHRLGRHRHQTLVVTAEPAPPRLSKSRFVLAERQPLHRGSVLEPAYPLFGIPLRAKRRLYDQAYT